MDGVGLVAEAVLVEGQHVVDVGVCCDVGEGAGDVDGDLLVLEVVDFEG